MADVGVTYTLVTPAGAVTFNSGLTDQFYIGEVQGLEGAPIRAPIDDVPFGDGGIVHDFWEGPRHVVFDGIFLITSTRVENNIVVIRNDMEETLRTCLRSIMSADGTLTWTPQGQASRTLTVRNDVPYEASHTDNYLNESFHFGLVAANPDWDGGRGFTEWENIFNARDGLLINFWSDSHDYSADLVAAYAPWGTGALGDVIQFLRPAGFTDVYVADVQSGDLTDVVEPDWASVPNIGDQIVDNDVTWINCGPLSGFPSIAPWQPLYTYELFGGFPTAAVTPTVANGHVYVAYPNKFHSFISDSVEPVFPTDGSNVQDPAALGPTIGFWLDMGVVP